MIGNKNRLLSLMGLIILLTTACSQTAQPTRSNDDNIDIPSQTSTTDDIGNMADELIKVLNLKGINLEKANEVNQPFFTVPGKVFVHNDENIQVFQYPSEESRKNESRLISNDGSVIGNNQIHWIDPPIIWAAGKLIVIYTGTNETIIGAIGALMGEPIARGDISNDSGEQPLEFPPAVMAAIEDLALKLGISESEIEVLSFEEINWADACLGLGRPDEACLQVITPGFLIKLMAMNTEYEYHTDQTGRNLRLAEGFGIIGDKPGLDLDRPVSILAAMRYLSKSIDVPVSDIKIISVEKVEWPDACLGLPGKGELCAEVIVPGWLIVLQAGTNAYELRTDLNGQSIRLKQ